MSNGEGSRISMRRQAALAEGGADYAAKRAELINVAARVFREKGYTSATLNDIAEVFGTDRASLYYYVGSKEELFHECIKGVLDDNLAKGEEIVGSDRTFRQKLTDLIEVVLSSYEESYPHMYVYIQEDMRHISSEDDVWATQMVEQTRRFEKMFLGLIEAGIADGSFRKDLDPSLVANGLFGMMTWTHRWFVPGRKYAASDLASVFTAIFFDGISAT